MSGGDVARAGHAIGLLLAVCLCLSPLSAGAQEQTIPTPRETIYAGELIQDGMIADAAAPAFVESDIVLSRADIVGRVARRTLFPGRPIQRGATEEARAVANGGPVQLQYDQPGLTITASGQALQAGRIGDAIRVRNVESGFVVSGVVTGAGAVRVDR